MKKSKVIKRIIGWLILFNIFPMINILDRLIFDNYNILQGYWDGWIGNAVAVGIIVIIVLLIWLFE